MRTCQRAHPDFFAVGGYDGMHLIYEALKKTGGKTDRSSADRRRQGDELGKPARHDLDRSENRRCRADRVYQEGREGGRHIKNVEIAKIPDVHDPVKAAMKK